MRGKAWSLGVVLALSGAAAVAGTLQAQEGGAEPLVRVLALGQGSYLGVFIADVTAEDVDRLGLPGEYGVRITGVADEGPAREAGLQEDDVIVDWNGDRVESQAQLRRILSETPPGRSATLGVIRSGSKRSMAVVLADRAGPVQSFSFGPQWSEPRADQLRRHLELNRDRLGDLRVRVGEMPHVMAFTTMRGGRLGVGIQSLERQLAEYFGLGDRTGVLITTVREDSPAEAAGLRAGDIILAIDGEEIEGVGDLSNRVGRAAAGPVALRILRDREERTVTVELPEPDNTFRLKEGEMNGFFFGPEGVELEFDPDDAHVEWAEPLRELSRIRIRERIQPFLAPLPAPVQVRTPAPGILAI